METHDELLSMVANANTVLYSHGINSTSTDTTLTTAGTSTSTVTVSPNIFQAPAGTSTLPGLNTWGNAGWNGLPGISGINGITIMEEAIKDLIVNSREDIVKSLETSIGLLTEKTGNEYEEQALKHLTYAKAFLEKSLLEKIKEKTDGNSKPD